MGGESASVRDAARFQKSVTHLFDGGRRGKPLLGQFDSQVGEAVELIFQFEEHLFCLCYSDLVLQGLELRAWNVNVEARCIDEFEEIGMDRGSMPKMKLFQRGEFICTECQVSESHQTPFVSKAVLPFNRKASAWVLFFWICNVR
jgi:hypothetical protein